MSARAAVIVRVAALAVMVMALPHIADAQDTPPKNWFGTYGTWADGNCTPNEDRSNWRCRPPKRLLGAVIAPAPNGRVRLLIDGWGADKECGFDGIGSWNGQAIVAVESDAANPAEACEITAEVKGSAVSTSGNEHCTCGSWTELDGEKKLSSETAIPPRYKPQPRKR